LIHYEIARSNGNVEMQDNTTILRENFIYIENIKIAREKICPYIKTNNKIY